MDHEINQQTQEAEIFAKENIVEVKDGRVCVDGRYATDDELTGFLSRAGGDFGYVMGLMALGVSPPQSVDMVYNFVTKNGGNFYYHTDTHSEHDQTSTGCGHIARSTKPENSEDYEVDPEKVKDALSYIRNEELHPNAVEVMLEGDHAEKGVFIVKGRSKTLRHQDKNAQYFVYDKDRDDEFAEKLVKEINREDISTEKLKEALGKQTNKTVELLAAGRPVFEVDLSNEEPKVVYLKTVPKAA